MITIICGKPGAGKTALLTYFQIQRMLEHGFEDFRNCKNELECFNEGGFDLNLPTQRHVCYSDFPVKFNSRLQSYSISGYEIGLPNIYYKTAYLPPYSTIFLDEAQRYYDSRMSKYLREETYLWYQLHRHNNYNIFMTCQRLGNIDLNIRAIAESFLVIDDLKIIKNDFGMVQSVVWKVRKFDSCDIAEAYMLAREKNENKEYGEVLEITCPYNVFKMYDSHGCKPVFYYDIPYRPYLYYTAEGYVYTVDGIAEYNGVHKVLAPTGYWKNAKIDKEIEAQCA